MPFTPYQKKLYALRFKKKRVSSTYKRKSQTGYRSNFKKKSRVTYAKNGGAKVNILLGNCYSS